MYLWSSYPHSFSWGSTEKFSWERGEEAFWTLACWELSRWFKWAPSGHYNYNSCSNIFWRCPLNLLAMTTRRFQDYTTVNKGLRSFKSFSALQGCRAGDKIIVHRAVHSLCEQGAAVQWFSSGDDMFTCCLL